MALAYLLLTVLVGALALAALAFLSLAYNSVFDLEPGDEAEASWLARLACLVAGHDDRPLLPVGRGVECIRCRRLTPGWIVSSEASSVVTMAEVKDRCRQAVRNYRGR